MKKYTIRLPMRLFDELKQQASSQDKKLSDYYRHLLKVGLQVEQLSQAEATMHGGSGRSSSESTADDQSLLWEKSLTWILESRFLLRSLVSELVDQNNGKSSELLTKSKTYAEQHVAGLLTKSLSVNII